MRSRVIKPEFWSDEKLGTLSMMERLLFIGLWNFADDEGLCKATPLYLKSAIFPYDKITESELNKALKNLSNNQHIYQYQINGQNYLWIIKFRVYQRIDKPQKPVNPPPRFSDARYKKSIFKRDQLICYICGEHLEFREFYIRGGKDSQYADDIPSVDHLIPRSKDGTDYPTNLKTACLKCNKSKSTKNLSDITVAENTIPIPFQERSKNGRDEEKLREEKLREEKKKENKLAAVHKSVDNKSKPIEEVFESQKQKLERQKQELRKKGLLE